MDVFESHSRQHLHSLGQRRELPYAVAGDAGPSSPDRQSTPSPVVARSSSLRTIVLNTSDTLLAQRMPWVGHLAFAAPTQSYHHTTTIGGSSSQLSPRAVRIFATLGHFLPIFLKTTRNDRCQSEDHARASELEHSGEDKVTSKQSKIANRGTTCSKLREGAEL